MRGCDCEAMVDGKCAYTLLLPAAQSHLAGCPGTQGGCSDMKQEVSELGHRVGNLSEVTGENTRAILQLQASLLHLTFNTSIKVNHDSSEHLNNITALAEKLQGEIGQIKQHMAELEEQLNHVADEAEVARESMLDTERRQRHLEERASETYELLQQLLHQVNSTDGLGVLDGSTCHRRGLLVSGEESRINSSKIRASSEYDADHSSEKVRIFTTISPAAWCPGEWHYVLIL